MQNIFYRCSCTRTQLVFIREFDEQSKVKKRHQLSVIWDYIHTLTGEKPQCNEDTRNLKQNNYHATVVLVWRALIRSVCLCLAKVFKHDAEVALEDCYACLQSQLCFKANATMPRRD